MYTLDEIIALSKKVLAHELDLQDALALVRRDGSFYSVRIIVNSLNAYAQKLIPTGDSRSFVISSFSYEIAVIVNDSQMIATSAFLLGSSLYLICRYRKALSYLHKCLPYFQHINDSFMIAETLGNIGACHSSTGELHKAIEYEEEALRYYRSINDIYNVNRLLCNIGLSYNYIGNYTNAINMLLLVINSQDVDDHSATKASAYGNIGLAYRNLARYEEAIIAHDKALQIYSALNRPKDIAACLNNLGLVCNHLSYFDRAVTYLSSSLEICKTINYPDGIAGALNNLGAAYHGLGLFSQAKDCFDQAIALYRSIDNLRGLENTFTNLARTNQALGKIDDAFNNYQLAIDTADKTGNLDSKRKWLENLAMYYENITHDDQQAYCCYEQAITLTENVRAHIQLAEDHRSSYFRTAENLYNRMICLCKRLPGKQMDSLVYLEMAKSRTFLESLANTDIRSTLSVEPDLITTEKELLTQLHILYTKTQSHDHDFSKEINNIETRLKSLYESIELIDPEYVSLRRGGGYSYEQLNNIVKLCDIVTCFIEYFIFASRLMIYLLRSDREELIVEEVQLPPNIYRHLDYFISSTRGHKEWDDISSFLIDPIKKYLAGVELIYFVPYGLLHHLPLHALKFDNDYLIYRYKIAYVPCLSIMKYCTNKRKFSRDKCLSIGVVFEKEADQIAKKFDHSIALIGNMATKSNIENAIGGKDIIHFSCHGMFVADMPSRSGLMLNNDEILTASDFYKMKIDADLVTLSACLTGINEIRPGDDLAGLTRSIIYAGTPSVVASLWSVSDEATMELMGRFYEYLKSNNDKATSLQKAQIDLMEMPQYSQPYYWAPFILIGDWK
jgi:tetratricopeptide (TPR) repeat protein